MIKILRCVFWAFWPLGSLASLGEAKKPRSREAQISCSSLSVLLVLGLAAGPSLAATAQQGAQKSPSEKTRAPKLPEVSGEKLQEDIGQVAGSTWENAVGIVYGPFVSLEEKLPFSPCILFAAVQLILLYVLSLLAGKLSNIENHHWPRVLKFWFVHLVLGGGIVGGAWYAVRRYLPGLPDGSLYGGLFLLHYFVYGIEAKFIHGTEHLREGLWHSGVLHGLYLALGGFVLFVAWLQTI